MSLSLQTSCSFIYFILFYLVIFYSGYLYQYSILVSLEVQMSYNNNDNNSMDNNYNNIIVVWLVSTIFE